MLEKEVDDDKEEVEDEDDKRIVSMIKCFLLSILSRMI